MAPTVEENNFFEKQADEDELDVDVNEPFSDEEEE